MKVCMVRVAVGSENPTKIRAVRSVIQQVWPDAVVQGVQVTTGVRPTPLDDGECIYGASERARRARVALDADLGIGLEGGVHPMGQELYLVGWVVVVDRSGRQSVASAARMPLPSRVREEWRPGEELGQVMDRLTGRVRTNQAEGAIGILTRNLATRQKSFETGLAYALAPWLNPAWYEWSGPVNTPAQDPLTVNGGNQA